MAIYYEEFLADRYICEARERWRIVHGARTISFRPDDGLVILTARIYNEASFALCARVRANDLRAISLTAFHKSVGFTIK